MPMLQSQPESGNREGAFRRRPLTREQTIRQAILRTFCEPLPEDYRLLQGLSTGQWRHLLRWLDISGLALYFFDRVIELKLEALLPDFVFARLQKSLNENTQRQRSMMTESIEIQQQFQAELLDYATLKGLSLWPCSVPKPELRSQFDLDFLVAEEDLRAARELLERRGYRLYGTSGRSWEFKRNEVPGIARMEMYKDTGSWCVELHAEPSDRAKRSKLDRIEWREFGGFNMPVLSPVDLFLGQGLHAYKHVCSEYSRAAHLLEFRRHILFRSRDESFWDALQSMAANSPQSRRALGVVTLLISETMGPFALDALTSWTTMTLSHAAKLWIEMYGHRAVLGSFPGTKLYLLLQREIDHSGSSRQPTQRRLIPLRLPPPVIRATANETIAVRIGRYRMQVQIIFSRLRFHFTEGLRLAWELHRWRRNLNQAAR